MASSKKTKGENEKRKTETPVKKKKKTTEASSKNRKNDKKSSSGTVSEPEVSVVVPSSSSESQNEEERGTRNHETPINDRGKNKKLKRNSKKEEEDEEEEEKEETSICRFPMKKMRRMIKSQFAESLVAGDAVFLVNKATEKFLEKFSAEAYACCIKDRKKSVSQQQLASVVSKQKRYDFLSDFLLEDVPLSKKPNNNQKTSNHTVDETEDLIVPSSSTESQEEQQGEQAQEKISQASPKNQRNKNMSSMKSGKRQEEDDKEDTVVHKFPMERMRRIMKSQESDLTVTTEAVFLVNKATEKFLEQFCDDAYACCVRDCKKSLHYQHLASVVSKKRRYDFLSDFVPEKLKAEDALAEKKLAESGQTRNLEAS